MVLVWVGITVALIAMAVPVIHHEKPGDERRGVKKCYSESDVVFLMGVMNASRTQATEILDLACDNAAGSQDPMR